jgi:endonuclease YncB( thermonuclease family)
MNRRTFLATSAALTAAGWTALLPASAEQRAPWADDLWDPARAYRVPGKTLRVQPVLMYRTSTPAKQTSYKSWGDVQSHEAAKEEARRIEGELNA